MAWQPNEKVTFTSHSGDKSVRELEDVTGEGFAVLKIGCDDDLVFTQNGNPINVSIDPLTKGPRIQKLAGQNSTKGTYNDPWHNEFATNNLTINELKSLLDILIEDKKGNEKLNLSKYKNSATIKTKVKAIFDAKKPKTKSRPKQKPRGKKKPYKGKPK